MEVSTKPYRRIHKEISAVGVDLSKGVMHVQAGNARGELIWRRKVNREGL